MASKLPVHYETSAIPPMDSKPVVTFNLQDCPASVLAQNLLQERFAGNVSQSIEFFRQAIESLNCTTVTPPEIVCSSDTSLDLRNPLLTTPLETSLLNPRGGKCCIQLYENGYLVATSMKTPSVQLVIPASAISHLILFARAEDYKMSTTKKVPNAHLVLLKLHKDATIRFQGKPVPGQVCFSLSWMKGIGPTGPFESTCGWQEAAQSWRQVLEQCLGGSHNPDLITCQIESGPSAPFLSYSIPDQSTTTGGMPFVKCYHGVQDGVLYPMREGLLFYKPPKFLPRSDLQSIACGRGSGGQSSSRYVDMVLQQQDGDVVEFTNIQREELAVLNDYIHQVLIPAMQGDVKNDNLNGKPENVMPEDEVTEDEDDDDVENDDDSDDDDENFVDADVDTEEEGDEDEENDSEEDGEDDYGDFEVVDDDFAKELAKKGTRVPDAPRASRSSKRKGLHAKATDDDDGFIGEDDDDDDFEVVQEAASATESEDEYERLGSPTKRGRK